MDSIVAWCVGGSKALTVQYIPYRTRFQRNVYIAPEDGIYIAESLND